MAKVLLIPSDEWGCGHARIFEPYSKIISEHQFLIHKERNLFAKLVWEFDAVVFQRPTTKGLPEMIRDLKRDGKIVVVETDDDLLHLPHTNPASEVYSRGGRLKIYSDCIREASYIHVSTPELKKALHNKSNIEVFFNGVDLKKFDTPKEKIADIIYWCSTTHEDSLNIIRPALHELKKKYKILLVSNKEWLNDLGFHEEENLKIMGWVPFEEHHYTPSLGKVALAPVLDNPMNQSRSELKCLEAGAWGVPTVCSNVAPYRRFNAAWDGNILVKKDRTKDWMKAVESLLENQYLYKEKSKESLATVKQFYDLEKINEQRALWWKRILK